MEFCIQKKTVNLTTFFLLITFFSFQAIGNALCATGFGESIAGLISETPNPWIERSVAAFVIVMLTLINLAGVKWVIRLQFVLLAILVLGAMDFGVGSFTHTNEGKNYILKKSKKIH